MWVLVYFTLSISGEVSTVTGFWKAPYMFHTAEACTEMGRIAEKADPTIYWDCHQVK